MSWEPSRGGSGLRRGLIIAMPNGSVAPTRTVLLGFDLLAKSLYLLAFEREGHAPHLSSGPFGRDWQQALARFPLANAEAAHAARVRALHVARLHAPAERA